VLEAAPSDLGTLQSLCPDLPPSTVENFLGRAGAVYLSHFPNHQIAQHLNELAKLSSEQPVKVMIESPTKPKNSIVNITVLAFDHPFEFSMICGVLTGVGFSFQGGDAFTLARPAVPKPSQAELKRSGRASRSGTWQSGRRAGAKNRDPLKHAVIIDRFTGNFPENVDFDLWSTQATEALSEVLSLLDRSDETSLSQAKRRVNQMVTKRIATLGPGVRPMLHPVSLTIEQIGHGQDSQCTRMKIVADDTPAFLYSLSTALSLRELSIEQVRIRQWRGLMEDQIDVVDRNGQPILDPDMLKRIRLSVLLTKQFTYFLDSSPDPFKALERFDKLADQIVSLPERDQWVKQISDPKTMSELARLLGASDYLWEDFIRTQYETLLPALGPNLEDHRFAEPPETLPIRMHQALESAVGLPQQRDKLNKFKDREIFLIDLDHILTPGSDFRELSKRLTLLAENLVATSAQLVYDDLVKSYGQPQNKDKSPASYAVFGLGKLGGVALGYASDIELLFVYNGEGTTSGAKRESIATPLFFEYLARETSQFIKTKREGIFEVDLRLRPYGKDAPLACSLKHFANYYGPEGEAHAFERMALVRLRWIAGDAKLGFDIESLRDRIVYQGTPPDVDALWDITVRQRQEKLAKAPASARGEDSSGNTPPRNAKYSSGALADLETTVILMQVRHADKVPQLRTPKLNEAIESLRRAGILTPVEFAQLLGAYHFLRRLINALRMLRGNAQDLFLPLEGSDELDHLARRMNIIGHQDQSAGQLLLKQFIDHGQMISAFVQRHFKQTNI
jgi:glutamate-ammonia-ligase adenylyltransferase